MEKEIQIKDSKYNLRRYCQDPYNALVNLEKIEKDYHTKLVKKWERNDNLEGVDSAVEDWQKYKQKE